MSDAAEFIRTQTAIGPAGIAPEIKLYLASEVTPLWQLTEERLKGSGLPPPYWAFAWPGGQGMARYLLDHPEEVRGKRVLDFAAGSGVAALAAMKAGAAKALAVDIDPMALTAIDLNAALNGVNLEVADGIGMEDPPKRIDVILIGDACYEQTLSARLMRWLWLCVAGGIRVLLADPGRAYVPREGLLELARYDVPVSRDLEDHDQRTVRVCDVGLPPRADD